MTVSKTQVDRLGERLRRGDPTDDDLRRLDAYRRSFAEPYAAIITVLRDELGLAPTGRPAKSTKSIVDKLSRETVRLSQIQDIAGCRVVVPDVAAQDDTVRRIGQRFNDVNVIDRRARPSHGYRAVHVLVGVNQLQVEVQVRTALQHLWAELSEKLSDRLGIVVKYGGGPPAIRSALDQTALNISQIEENNAVLTDSLRAMGALPSGPDLAAELDELRATQRHLFDVARSLLEQAITELSRTR